MPPLYLDYAATTPVDPAVAERMRAVMVEDFGNPSSAHALGRRAKSILDNARATLAGFLNCDPAELHFTSGGTEADCLALLGAARRFRGGHVVISAIEHAAVFEAAEQLHREGFELRIVPVDASGIVDMQAWQQALSPDTRVAALMLVNNETGAVQPVTEAAKLAKAAAPDCTVLCDAVQAFGKIPVDFNALGVDFLSISAHKIYGPKGAGALIVHKTKTLLPLQYGGSGFRPGTAGVPGIAGLAECAARLLPDLQSQHEKLARLTDTLYHGLRQLDPGLIRNGPESARDRAPNILNVSFSARPAPHWVLLFDAEGICVSSGAACSSGLGEPSRVILAMGRKRETALNAVRFSVGAATCESDIQTTLRATRKILEGLRRPAGSLS